MKPKRQGQSAEIVFLEGRAGLLNPEVIELSLSDAGSPELDDPTLGVT